MITLRNTASAFLFYENEILLMLRSPAKKLNPGAWASVGGHLKKKELNDPQAACLREINEETGLKSGDIEDLKLKYMIIRREDSKVGIQYLYFGRSKTRQVTDCDEGTLHWIVKDGLFDLELPPVNRMVLKHYFETGCETRGLFVGIVGLKDNELTVTWSILGNIR